jgi:hypothetical protein
MTDPIYQASRILTFLIGPPVMENGPATIRDDGQLAIDVGDAVEDAMRELLFFQKNAAERIIDGGTDSPFSAFVKAAIGEDLASLSADTGKGSWKGAWFASIVIDLDETQTIQGEPLATLLPMEQAKYVAAFIGQAMNADWVRTSRTEPHNG